MSLAKETPHHEISMVVDGMTKIFRNVTKYTTCDDIINKLPRTGAPLAIFQSTNGKEKELSAKTKLLKVWRAHGSSKTPVFTVKPSEGRKTRRLSLNIFGGRNSRKSTETAAKDQVKPVSDLAFYIQKMKSASSVENKGVYLTNPDRTRERRAAIQDRLRTMKLGFKRKAASQRSLCSQTSSASTIKSTDTGYQSQVSDTRSQVLHDDETPLRHTPLAASSDTVPRHSTPVRDLRKHDTPKEAAGDSFDVTLTSTKSPRFDETEGKTMLMRRFMVDTTICEANKRERKTIEHSPTGLERRNIYASAPVLFRSQEEKCRFYWDQNCDTDSDSSCSDEDDDSFLLSANLDDAFVEYSYSGGSFSKRMRRESAMSNLNKFQLSAKQFEETYFDAEPEDNGFSYSFNCSFPEFSESEDFSVNYECNEIDGDLSSSFEESYHFGETKDAEMYSFMTSKECLAIDENVRGRSVSREEIQSEAASDEGLGSMESDSFSDDREFFI